MSSPVDFVHAHYLVELVGDLEEYWLMMGSAAFYCSDKRRGEEPPASD